MHSFANFFSLLTFAALQMAFFSYNGFAHPPGQCSVQFHFDAIENEAKQAIAYKARVDITGMLISQAGSTAACQADLSAQIAAIQNAYKDDGGDAILVLDDGTASPNSVLNEQTLGGVRVIQRPSFPEGGADEYATIRHFTCALEAEVPTVEGQTALQSFEEELTFEGTGGPAYDVIECVQGAPVQQILKQQTAMRCVQSGRAVGYLGYWTQMYADPLFPALEQQQLRVQIPGSPKRIGSGSDAKYKFFPTIWRYTFKSPTPITGTPNRWPI